MRRLILSNYQAPGDIVMLTAAVRDLHVTYPGQFLTDVRTSCPELWDHNPYLTSLAEKDPQVEAIDCDYPLINKCNASPYHVIHGLTDFLCQSLIRRFESHAFRGD